ncbi:MAG: heparinase II/III family protein, partial [Gemmatimonadetes bacterium]|nr:heparinase II/III family protein [Gemmatimonadota bacterium]
GPHWSCGQETAIRAIALLYAEANLPHTPGVAGVLAQSGERIADALGYAVSQRNNHAISEAVGLLALGARFRGQHPRAEAWLRRGRRWVARLVREQFADDGWYVQHSFTYLRLALDQCVAAERALRHEGRALSPAAAARLRAGAELLLTVMEPETGHVPNHGASDGAFVHPITLAEYRDFRPVATAAGALWGLPLPANVAPDRETLAWLGLDTPAAGRPLGDGLRVGTSGWAAARAGGTAVFLRAGRYTSRPGHIDPLHLDVRMDGREVVVDPGTYAYNAPPPWRNGLAGAAAHNGPLVDGLEPGVRGPRFLWYLWPEARLVSAGPAGDGYELVAEIPGTVRRVVRVLPGEVVVDDTVLRPGARQARVFWLLHPDADPGQVQVAGGQTGIAVEGDPAGWFSPGYGVRLPSRFVSAGWDPGRDPRLRTVVRRGGPAAAGAAGPRP